MSNQFLIQPDAIYTDGEVRLALGVTSSALVRARRESRLKFTRQGHSVLYRGQWLLDWLEHDARPDRSGCPMCDAPTSLRQLDEIARRETIQRLIAESGGKLMRGDDPRLTQREKTRHA